MHRHSGLCTGFSLVELSIVIVILSIITMLGLEAATAFLGRNAYLTTEAQLRELDKRIDAFYNTYGYLPCPAKETTSPTSSDYGWPQDCTVPPLSGMDVVAGSVPFRLLGLPASAAIDGFGNRVYYFVTLSLTSLSSFAVRPALIEMRSGQLAEPCTGTCSVLALPNVDPALSTGAAYALLSTGADERGATSVEGVPVRDCAKTGDIRIDAQNCYMIAPAGSLLPATIPDTVLYDSRYNSGSQDVNYFDDAIVWRPKDKL